MATQPEYIYKIVPSTSPPPEPLPLSLPVSPLDAKDNYIHCSTSSQLLGTLNRFFADPTEHPFVYILRIPYVRISSVVKWEFPSGEAAAFVGEEGAFAHLYNGLRVGEAEVDAVGTWRRGNGEWTVEGWPWGAVDCPV